MTRPPSEPDLCVIGASEPGRTAAMAAVAMGLSVVLIDEAGDAEGLDNPEVVLESLRNQSKWHRNGAPSSDAVNADRVLGHLRAAARAASADRRLDRLAAMNIRVLRGTGRFADRKTVTVGEQSFQPWRTIIATGATKSGMPETLAAGGRCFSIGGLHRLDTVPTALTVLGGGAYAVSAAQSFARFGTAVSLVSDSGLLQGIDPELTTPLLSRLTRMGVKISAGASLAIHAKEDGCLVRLDNNPAIGASHCIIALEGEPALDRLAVSAAGINRLGKSLQLTRSMRTTNPGVYAIGRAAGASSAQQGLSQAAVALRAAFLRLPPAPKPDISASVTITDPEIGVVGLSEAQARAQEPVAVWRWPFAETTAGFAGGEQEGHIKVVTDRKGKILGAGMVGSAVRDIVPFWSLAIARGLTLDSLATVSIPVPSLSEASRRLVLGRAVVRLGNPWLKRALSVSRWFG